MLLYQDVLDSSIVLNDILVTEKPYYKDFANSVCGFVMNAWPGLKYVNGIPMELIRYLGTNYTTCKATHNKIEFESVEGYGINSTWSLPKDGIPSRNLEAANYIGYYIYNGQEKIVIYGFFDENGYIKHIPGTLSEPILLYIDNWNWVYHDESTNLDRVTKFPVISGCRIDALPTRNDCATNVIQKYFDYTQLYPDIILGDIPIIFLENGTWYFKDKV